MLIGGNMIDLGGSKQYFVNFWAEQPVDQTSGSITKTVEGRFQGTARIDKAVITVIEGFEQIDKNDLTVKI